jgi:hypothetical protein
MNKSMLCVVLLAVASCSYAGQDVLSGKPRHEFSGAAGIWSSRYLHDVLGDYLDDKWSGGNGDSPDYSMQSTAILKLGYAYRVGEHTWVTLSASRQRYRDDNRKGDIDAYLLGLRRDWSDDPSLSIYSRIAGGQARIKYDDAETSHSQAYQIDLIGYSYHYHPMVSVYGEVGVGYEGLLKLGVAAQF